MLTKKEIKVFVSCPDDVEKEKLMVIEACKFLSKIFNSRLSLRVIEWRQDVVPLITGEGAQSVINEQIKEDYDLYIGIFWKRFGNTHTNGYTPTEEEFEKALKRYQNTKKPLITVYFMTDGFNPCSSYEKKQMTEFNNSKID